MHRSGRKLIEIFFLLITPFVVQAQNDITPSFLVKPFAGLNGGLFHIQDAVATHDGYIYTAGYFNATADFDLGPDTFNLDNGGSFIAKYDAGNKLVFAFNLSSEIKIASITTDNNDNVFVTGYFYRNADFDPGPDNFIMSTGDPYQSDIFIAKYKPDGSFVMAKKIGGINEQHASAITLDEDGNIYIAGTFNGQRADFDPGPGIFYLPNIGGDNSYFAKYSPQGNFIWAKSITVGKNNCTDIAVDKNKNVVITGYFKSAQADFDPGPGVVNLRIRGYYDAYIAKYDSLGNYVFALPVGGESADFGLGITTDDNGNIYATGSFTGKHVSFNPSADTADQVVRKSNGGSDIYLAKYAPDGSLKFVNTFGGTLYDYGRVIAVDDKSNVYISGTFQGNGVDFFPGPGVDTLSSAGADDIFFAKYDSTGKHIYAERFGGLQNESPAAIVLPGESNALLCGSFTGDVNVKAKTGTQKISFGLEDAFFAFYNTKGEVLAVRQIQTYRPFNLYSSVIAITQDKERNTYVTGQFEGSIDFDPGPGTYYLTSTTDAITKVNSGYEYDIYFAKYDADGKLIFAKNISGPYSEYPSSMAIDDDDNIYIAGYCEDSTDFDPGSAVYLLSPDSPYHRTQFFAKYNASGALLFAKKIQMVDYYGGNINGIAIDQNKHIYITGYFHQGDFDPGTGVADEKSVGSLDIFLASYDSLGEFTYFKQMGQTGNYDGYGNNIFISPKNKIIITGYINGTAFDFDPGPGTYLLNSGRGRAQYVSGYSMTGDLLFASCVHAYKNSSSVPAKSALDRDGNIYITGYFNTKIDFDPGPDSLIIIAKPGILDIFFQKFDYNGNYLFTKIITTNMKESLGDIANSIFADKNENIYITGTFSGKVDFDPGPDTVYVTQQENVDDAYDVFLARYDNSGNYVYAYNFGNVDTLINASPYTGFNIGEDIYVNDAGEVLLGGETSGNLDLGPGTDTLFLHPTYAGYNFFLIKYLQQTSSLIAIPVANISLSPALLNREAVFKKIRK